MISMLGLDEVNGILSSVGIVGMNWFEPRMIWDPAYYNDISEILIPGDYVWKPEVILANPVKKFRNLGSFNSNVRYYANGLANLNEGEFMETSCDIDVTHYPFDIQDCSIKIIPTSGNFGGEVLLNSSQNYIDLKYYSPHGEWILKESNVDTARLGNLVSINFNVKLERRSAFIVINLFIPVIILVLLNCMVFLLPADSGERIGFAMTCLLALAVYLTLVSESLPNISSPLPVLSIVLLLCLAMSTSIVLMVIASLRLHLKDTSKPVPVKLKHFALCITCKRNCIKQERVDSLIHVNIVDDQLTPSNTPKSVDIKEIHAARKKQKTSESRWEKQWHKAIDLHHEKQPPKSTETSHTKQNQKVTEPESVKQSPKENSWCKEEENFTWKDFAIVFDNMCFISILSFTLSLGILYLMVVGGRL
ncbi:hypothetical protein FSP39_014948 [Pinctada imbricata]|uniref:Uncharacterized protein n=1 Tax=Pinctada imbricata TaxID=66713 RepID=A0AA88XFI9_PINIB|nr:hypothetical protein FSP39_014948 [Pinctada imbricata]